MCTLLSMSDWSLWLLRIAYRKVSYCIDSCLHCCISNYRYYCLLIIFIIVFMIISIIVLITVSALISIFEINVYVGNDNHNYVLYCCGDNWMPDFSFSWKIFDGSESNSVVLTAFCVPKDTILAFICDLNTVCSVSYLIKTSSQNEHA